MGRITSFSKQVIVFFLVTALIIRPTFAANVGGWTMSNPIASGASTIYNGAKTVLINGANVVKNGTAKITPTAANVSKVLARGGAGYALSIAVEQLLGAVDWVLDPANNQINYNKPTTFSVYKHTSGTQSYQTAQAACAAYLSFYKTTYGANVQSYKLGSEQIKDDSKPKGIYQVCTLYYSTDQTGSGVSGEVFPTDSSQDERKSIPLDTVSTKVIENANAGDADAQVATMAAAADIVKEAETDQVKAAPIVKQLENSAVTETDETATGTQTKNPTNPDVTDLSLEFPAFCGWAPTVCEAAQTVISFPTTLTNWWDTATSSISEAWTKVKEEYADKPQENTDTELEIPDLEQDIQVDTDISFGGSCPRPLSSDINFMGLNKTIEFSFDPVCQIAEFIKPVVISISAFSAALIVAGIRTEDD